MDVNCTDEALLGTAAAFSTILVLRSGVIQNNVDNFPLVIIVAPLRVVWGVLTFWVPKPKKVRGCIAKTSNRVCAQCFTPC